MLAGHPEHPYHVLLALPPPAGAGKPAEETGRVGRVGQGTKLGGREHNMGGEAAGWVGLAAVEPPDPILTASSLPPFSPWICTHETTSASPRKPFVEWEAYTGVRGPNSFFLAEAYSLPCPRLGTAQPLFGMAAPAGGKQKKTGLGHESLSHPAPSITSGVIDSKWEPGSRSGKAA